MSVIFGSDDMTHCRSYTMYGCLLRYILRQWYRHGVNICFACSLIMKNKYRHDHMLEVLLSCRDKSLEKEKIHHLLLCSVVILPYNQEKEWTRELTQFQLSAST